MDWNAGKTFIYQMVICIFVYTIIICGAVLGNVVRFYIDGIFSVIYVVAFLFGVVLPTLRIIILGMKVLLDFVLKKTTQNEYLFIKEIPISYSIFSEKNDKQNNKTVPCYYQIIVEKDDMYYYFLSAEYLELSYGGKYTIKSSKLSKMIIDIVTAK